MDQTTVTLIVINLILNFLQVLDHFLTKIKRSKCFGGELEMNNDKTDNQPKELDQSELIKQIKALTNNKQDDPANKL